MLRDMEDHDGFRVPGAYQDVIAAHGANFRDIFTSNQNERREVHGFGRRSGWLSMGSFLGARKVV